jgi:hypothetical protein
MTPIRYGEPVEIVTTHRTANFAAHWFGWLERIDDDGTIHYRPIDFPQFVLEKQPADSFKTEVFRASRRPGYMERAYSETYYR